MRPRCRESFSRAGVYRIGSIRRLLIFTLNAMVISRNLLYHPLRGASNDCRIQRMMKITIRTHLCQSPAFAQVAGNGTCQRHDSLFPRSRMIRKCKMVTNVIQQETRHILCVLQITLLEAVLFLFTQGFPQQIFLLAIVANLRLSPYNKFFALFSLKILQRQSISLLPVFSRHYQNFVATGIIKTNAVRHNMVHLSIARFKQPFRRNTFL